MAWADSVLNAGAQVLADASDQVALYLGDPGGGGTEVSGGSYARLQPGFPSPAIAQAGVSETADTVTFDIPAGGNFDHVGVYDSVDGLVNAVAVPEELFGNGGTYDLTVTCRQTG